MGASCCPLPPCAAGAAGRLCRQRKGGGGKIFLLFLLQPLMRSQILPGSGTFPDCPSSWHGWLAGSEPRCHPGRLRRLSGSVAPCHTTPWFYHRMKTSFLDCREEAKAAKATGRRLPSCPALLMHIRGSKLFERVVRDFYFFFFLIV